MEFYNNFQKEHNNVELKKKRNIKEIKKQKRKEFLEDYGDIIVFLIIFLLIWVICTIVFTLKPSLLTFLGVLSKLTILVALVATMFIIYSALVIFNSVCNLIAHHRSLCNMQYLPLTKEELKKLNISHPDSYAEIINSILTVKCGFVTCRAKLPKDTLKEINCLSKKYFPTCLEEHKIIQTGRDLNRKIITLHQLKKTFH